MLIDTHAHLWWPSYYPPMADQPGYYDDLEEVLLRAKAAGVEKIVCPGTNVESSQKAIQLAKKYPGVVYAAVGIHPEEVLSTNSNEETPPTFGVPTRPLAGSPVEESPLGLRDLLSGRDLEKTVVAIGEIGTDASSEELKGCMEKQKKLFRAQCGVAIEHDLPVIIHTRNSLSEALEVLDALPKMPKGQFHCFSHDEDGVKQVLKRGFYVSFCGNITWSKRVAKLVPLVPNDRLLLETDSPFMIPRVARARQTSPLQERNEPMNVTITAQMIADLRGSSPSTSSGHSLQEIAEQTTENAVRLFKL